MTQHKSPPWRILMTLDAVGGVWQYALDLATGLRQEGCETVFAGFGPKPSAQQLREAESIGRVVWMRMPLDWMSEEESAVATVPALIADLAEREGIDLVHLNVPSQAAGLVATAPVLVVSHSCVVTWFAAVRGQVVPGAWQWQARLNRMGFDRADAVLAPSRSHADLLQTVYGHIAGLDVVYNASRVTDLGLPKKKFVFAAGRWWDDGKNGAVLDSAARQVDWPVIMAGASKGPGGQSLAICNAVARGELPHNEAMILLAQAAIFVSPSLYEPFGLAPLEAARSGSALVLADIATYRELWDGAALFADARDPDAFADIINRLARDPAHRCELARRARKASRRFSSQYQTHAMVRHYRRLLSSKIATTAADRP
jgi:glycosyltransferase involved in cell wall biosynthesis